MCTIFSCADTKLTKKKNDKWKKNYNADWSHLNRSAFSYCNLLNCTVTAWLGAITDSGTVPAIIWSLICRYPGSTYANSEECKNVRFFFNQCCCSGYGWSYNVSGPPGSASGSVSHKCGSFPSDLISTILWLLHDVLSLKNYVNVDTSVPDP